MVALETLDTFFLTFWIILGMVALVGVWFFFGVISKFKYKVRIRELVNGRKVIIDDKARLIKKDGLEYWKLMKLKDIIPVPPPQAIGLKHSAQQAKPRIHQFQTDIPSPTGDEVFALSAANASDIVS